MVTLQSQSSQCRDLLSVAGSLSLDPSSYVHTQSSSALFNVLPAELRQQIYLYVLGGRDLHLFGPSLGPNWHGKWQKPVFCLAEMPLRRLPQRTNDARAYHGAMIWAAAQEKSKSHELQRSKQLSLLRCCRRMHNEALPVLFTANKFIFALGVDDIIELNARIHTKRLLLGTLWSWTATNRPALELVQRLDINFTHTYYCEDPKGAWSIIKEMRYLTNLRLWILFIHSDEDQGAARQLAKGVRGFLDHIETDKTFPRWKRLEKFDIVSDGTSTFMEQMQLEDLHEATPCLRFLKWSTAIAEESQYSIKYDPDPYKVIPSTSTWLQSAVHQIWMYVWARANSG